MATTSRVHHPQFFHTLVPGFHTHFTIPEDFFLKYVEGGSVAEVKSDVSDRTWQVKMSGRRFTDGWEEFTVANYFRIGDVVLVRYVGDSVFHVSDLGPNHSEIQDNDEGKKRLHQVEFSSNNEDGDDDEELPREKRARKNSEGAEAVSSSSSSADDNSCFVLLVTALNLRTDKLYLPLHFTSSNCLTRKCREIVLTDGKERSWALDLGFDESSDTFYISRGWRSFCDENGQKAGGFFMFQLVGNGETPVLSLYPTESISDRRQRDCSEASKRESVATKLSSVEENIAREGSKDECSSPESLMDIEKRKSILKPRDSPYSSYSPCHKRFIKFTLPPYYDKIGKLSVVAPFVRENGIKPGEIFLLDKDGRRWLTNLLLDCRGTMALGKGWKDFVKANSLESGFTLKLIWEETIPVLSLCCAESNNDRELEEFLKAIEKKKSHLKWRDSTPSSRKQFVTLTITPYSVENSILRLSMTFTRVNDIKPGIVTLLGKDGIKHQTNLLLDKTCGRMAFGKGWKDFVKGNGLKTGDTFTLKLLGKSKLLCSACVQQNVALAEKQQTRKSLFPSNLAPAKKSAKTRTSNMTTAKRKTTKRRGGQWIERGINRGKHNM